VVLVGRGTNRGNAKNNARVRCEQRGQTGTEAALEKPSFVTQENILGSRCKLPGSEAWTSLTNVFHFAFVCETTIDQRNSIRRETEMTLCDRAGRLFSEKDCHRTNSDLCCAEEVATPIRVVGLAALEPRGVGPRCDGCCYNCRVCRCVGCKPARRRRLLCEILQKARSHELLRMPIDLGVETL